MRYFYILIFLIAPIVSAQASKPLCAPAVIETAVEKAAVIFEGKVTAVKPEAGNEYGRIYTFTVFTAWKGTKEGATVDIRREIYWNELFKNGEAYLVLATTNRDMLEVDVCSHFSAPLDQAGKSLKYLKSHIKDK